MPETTQLEGGGTVISWAVVLSAAGGVGRSGKGVFVPSCVPEAAVCKVPRYQLFSLIGGLGSSPCPWGHLSPDSLPRDPLL